MKACCSALFLLVFCCGAVARADSIVSGSIETNHGNCSSSGDSTGTGTLDLSCGTAGSIFSPGTVWANATGSASATNVQGTMLMGTGPGNYASGSVMLSMDGWYMLTGGDGFGYADWSLSAENSESGPGYFGPCSVTVDGVTELCDPYAYSGVPGGETGSFYVPYDTPFQLDFTGSLDLYSAGESDGGAGGPMGMSFTLTNLEEVPTPTPEPASWGLVGLGILALCGGVAMRRFASA